MSAEAAEALHADAFTVGEDIFFAAGAFSPDTEAGQRLLAHELTHVVQAWQGRTREASRVSQPGDPLEREAEAVASHAGHGAPTAAPFATSTPSTPAAMARQLAAEEQQATAAQPAAPLPAPPPASNRPLLRRAAAGGTRGRGKLPAMRGGAKRGPGAPGQRRVDGAGDFTARAGRAGRDATHKLHRGIADARARPPGDKALTQARDAHKQNKSAVRAAHGLGRQHRGAHGHAAAVDAVAPASSMARADTRTPIAFKPITDWAKYVPPLPGNDKDPGNNKDKNEATRKRIEALIKAKIESDRAQCKQALDELHTAHVQRAAELRAAKPRLVAQIAAAQGAALARSPAPRPRNAPRCRATWRR